MAPSPPSAISGRMRREARSAWPLPTGPGSGKIFWPCCGRACWWGCWGWPVSSVISLLLSTLALRPAERSWQQQKQFVADASHELKTPLTVILANAGILLAHSGDMADGQRKWVEYIQAEAQRMKSLVEDLLFLARSDDRRSPLRLQTVSFSDLAWEALLPLSRWPLRPRGPGQPGHA